MFMGSSIKMSVFLRLTCKFKYAPNKNSHSVVVFFIVVFLLDKPILKFIWKSKTILEKNKVRDLLYQLKA